MAGPGALRGIHGPNETPEARYVRYRDTYIKANGTDEGFDKWWKEQSNFARPDDPTFLEEWLNQINKDRDSGEMEKRIISMFKNAPEGAWHGLVGTVEMLGTVADYTAKYGAINGPMVMAYDQAMQMYQNRDQISADLYKKLDDFNNAMLGHDTEAQGKIFGEILGQAEFQAILGKGMEAGMKGPGGAPREGPMPPPERADGPRRKAGVTSATRPRKACRSTRRSKPCWTAGRPRPGHWVLAKAESTPPKS